jgi:hypothetical protein
MDGIFCSNFCKYQRGYPPCPKTWHANCYKCLGIGEFPVKFTRNAEGNPWFKQRQREERCNHGIRGVHASIPFQCEDCWMINLKGHLPVPILDDTYVMLLHQANLDAMLGRAVATIKAHAAAVKRLVRLCKLIRKTPAIPPRDPMAAGDTVVMSIVVDMLLGGLTGKPRIKGQQHIQFDSMHKVRGTFTSAWESLPREIQEGSSISTGMGKTTLTQCLTQQKWFGLFLQGTEIQMGYATQANKPLSTPTIVRLLELVKREAKDKKVEWISNKLYKFGAAAAIAMCESL